MVKEIIDIHFNFFSKASFKYFNHHKARAIRKYLAFLFHLKSAFSYNDEE
jgi:hypothetical protein